MKDFRVTMSLRNNQLRERREAMGLSLGQMDELIGLTVGTYGMMERFKVKPTKHALPTVCVVPGCDSPVTWPPARGVCHGCAAAKYSDKDLKKWRKVAAAQLPPVWSENALKVAEFFRVGPRELWSDIARTIVESESTALLDGEELVSLSVVPAARLISGIGPDSRLVAAEARALLNEALSSISPREEKVLRMRFGMVGDDDERPEMTPTEVANAFELSVGRIRQIEEKALRRLRHPSRSKRLAGDE